MANQQSWEIFAPMDMYISDNICQKVECRKVSSMVGQHGNDPIVAGKSDWKCTTSWTLFRSELTLGAVGKLKYTPECPPGPPVQGWNSTCEAGGSRANTYPR